MESLNCAKQKSLVRDSNMELLRIIAMAFVVLGHFNGFGFEFFTNRNKVVFVTPELITLAICESLFIIGVDLFVLISGYFGIKLKWRSLINLFCICFFYSVVLTVFKWFVLSEPFSIEGFIKTFLPISRRWWFVNVYFCLMLCAPFLNKAIENLRNRDAIIILLLFVVVNCYFGFFQLSDAISGAGYSLVNFIFIYYVGRLMKRFERKLIFKKWLLILTYFICTLLMAASYLVAIGFLIKINGTASLFLAYNSPLVLLSSISVFLLFKQFSFKSKLVNWVAASVFAVYLIHVDLFGILFPFNTNSLNYIGSFGIKMFAHLLLLFVGIFIVCIMVDQIRIFIMKPIVPRLTSIMERLQTFVFAKLKI